MLFALVMKPEQPQPDHDPDLTDAFAIHLDWLRDVSRILAEIQLALNHLKARVYLVEEIQG